MFHPEWYGHSATSSGVCGQCESVRFTRGLTGVSVVAVTVVTMTVLAAVPLPLCWHCLRLLLFLHTPSTTTSFLCSAVPLGILSAFAFEPLSSAFGLKPLPDCELKPKLLREKKNHRREVRVASGLLLRPLWPGFSSCPFICHGPVSENQTMKSKVKALTPCTYSAARWLSELTQPGCSRPKPLLKPDSRKNPSHHP